MTLLLNPGIREDTILQGSKWIFSGVVKCGVARSRIEFSYDPETTRKKPLVTTTVRAERNFFALMRGRANLGYLTAPIKF